ncbi:MAG: PQQ-binding-like beta-propeller repeat protein, partial [Chloroflexia bacterium]
GVVALVAVGFILLGRAGGIPGSVEAEGSGDWPTYMYDGARSGFNGNETRLSPDNAPGLKLLWKQKLGNVLAAQPVIKGDTLYEGSWDGFLYALDTKDGAVKWKKDLGRTTSGKCAPDTAGITSAAAVTDKALYIGGGDDQLYALDPGTGDVIWKFKTGDNSPAGGAYNWASPLVYKDRVYYGTASFCDKPFTHAEMWGVNTATGKADRQASFVPGDQRGGGIWTSPTIDEATGALYVTIGSGDYYIPHNYSIARLDPNSMAVVDAWQIPSDDQVFDGDWGTTPTLFRDNAGAMMVGAAAKNGYYYAFRAGNIEAGPVWRARIADGGECPQCGDGSISSSAYAYDTIYAAGGYLSLGVTQKFAGTVRALDPTTGAVRWIHPTTGAVIPALAAANGLVAAAGGDTVEVLNAATGELLWEYATEGQLYAAPSIAGGVLYVASTDGYVYAFSAGPYPEPSRQYEVPRVGLEPPPFSLFRKLVEAPRAPGGEAGSSNKQCFPETGKCAYGDFLAFWKEHGGLERFGPAMTGELNEAERVVQYFRNATLELHAKDGGQGTEVRFGKLDFRLAYYRPQDSNFEPAQPAPGATYIAETHHNLQDPFLSYWRAHGDVANLGYPVSEPFDETDPLDGQTRRVQYFERSRLELTGDQEGSRHVTLGALGIRKYQQRYGKMP